MTAKDYVCAERVGQGENQEDYQNVANIFTTLSQSLERQVSDKGEGGQLEHPDGETEDGKSLEEVEIYHQVPKFVRVVQKVRIGLCETVSEDLR